MTATMTATQNQTQSIQSYLAFLSSHPHLGTPVGSSSNGEIELVTDEAQIAEVIEASVHRLLGGQQQGMTEELARKESQVGVITKDRYWMWVRDPVKFPSGALGTFNRIIPMCVVNLAHSGAAALPMVTSSSSCSQDEPKFVLLITFRHATRSWEAELPRGGPLEGTTVKEPAAQTAVREVEEETGWHSSTQISSSSISSPPRSLLEPKLLGYVNSDSGELTQTVPVYLVSVSPPLATEGGGAGVEFSEAIHGCVILTLTQVKEAIRVGWLPPPHSRVPVRDPYLTFAILQGILQGSF